MLAARAIDVISGGSAGDGQDLRQGFDITGGEAQSAWPATRIDMAERGGR